MAGTDDNPVTFLRVVSTVALCIVFGADYGVDAFAKPVPWQVYLMLIAFAVGVDSRSLRDAVLTYLQTYGRNGNGNGKPKT